MLIKKRTLKLLLIFFVIVIAGLSTILYNHNKMQKISTNIQKYYYSITGNDVEVLEIKRVNNQYKTELKIGSESATRLLDKQKIHAIQNWLHYHELFKSCLDEKGIKIFVKEGQSSEWQLNVLPLLDREAAKYTVNCDIEPNKCKEIGIATTPSLLYNGHIYPGPKWPKSFMTITGCVPAHYAVDMN